MTNRSKKTEAITKPRKPNGMSRTPEEIALYVRFEAYRLDAEKFNEEKRAKNG